MNLFAWRIQCSGFPGPAIHIYVDEHIYCTCNRSRSSKILQNISSRMKRVLEMILDFSIANDVFLRNTDRAYNFVDIGNMTGKTNCRVEIGRQIQVTHQSKINLARKLCIAPERTL